MRKLQKMCDFIFAHNTQLDNPKTAKIFSKYAMFLGKELLLKMFIACDYRGVPIEPPVFVDTMEAVENNTYSLEMDKYVIACNDVIFEGFEVVSNNHKYKYIDIKWGTFILTWSINAQMFLQYSIVEDLCNIVNLSDSVSFDDESNNALIQEIDHLEFIYNRMAYSHQENTNIDYMLRLERIINDKKTIIGILPTTTIQHEYEMFFYDDVEINEANGEWVPIPIENINPEKIDHYIAGGSLRRII